MRYKAVWNRLIGLLLFSVPVLLFAQKTALTVVQGTVNDAETHTPIPFATVSVPGVSLGVTTDENGKYVLKTERRITEIKFTVIGYNALVREVKPGKTQTIDVDLSPATQLLQEVVIKPEKYKKKDNPARELIEEVIAHRADNHIENLRTYRDEQYEKIFFGLSNLGDKLEDRRMMRQARFVLENRDTSKFAGVSVVPVFLQENVADCYRRSDPKRKKTYIKATQSVTFPGTLDQKGINNSLQYLYEEIDIYDNYVTLLTDQFLSPIAPSGPLFYRYYAADTLMEDGRKIVKLEFFPKNKTDMLLQGELYVALDSSFAVTKVSFTVGEGVNLNWVQDLQVEQEFQRLPAGKWIVRTEDYRLHFGVLEGSLGLVGQRYLVHRDAQINEPIADSLFAAPDDVMILPGADHATNPVFWAENRPVPLNAAESETYTNLDSLQNTRFYKNTRFWMHTLIGGYAPAGKAIEIGPLASFYAYNDVEGWRFRLGGRTREELSRRYRIEGYAGYGLRDEKWKYSIAGRYALGNSVHNEFPLNIVRASYTSDVMLPMQIFQGSAPTSNIFGSVVRGANDKFFYFQRFNAHYEREYRNHFSWQAGVMRQQFQPAGALRFEPATGGPAGYDPGIEGAPYIILRYAPGEKSYQGSSGRMVVDFNYIATVQYNMGKKGFLDGQYDFHQVTASIYKYMNTPPFGYNTTYIEAGGIFGNGLPYPLLAMHPGNQSYIYQQYSYNMMNFMEFISDRYVTLISDHYFNGFFLNKIPLLRRLKLREVATVKVLYGGVSRGNRPDETNGLYRFPTNPDNTPITYTLEDKPYVEASIGVSNILKVFRIDFMRRFTYLDHPGAARFGVKAGILMTF